MIDKITSVFDNYSGKIKNPFIGTIISVWLIHNWRIPFALFNFDKECTMIDKINFIADYFGKQDFWIELGKIIGISLLILIFTFILLGISRALTDFYYNVIESKIITKIDEKAIYTKDEKARLEKRISNMNSKIEIRDDEILKLEANITKISLEKTNEISILNEQIQKEKDNYKGVKTIYAPFNSVRSEFDKYFDRISTDTLRNLYTLIDDSKNVNVQNKNDVDFLVLNGIIYIEYQNIKTMDISILKSINESNKEYILTKYGKLFVKYIKESDKFI